MHVSKFVSIIMPVNGCLVTLRRQAALHEVLLRHAASGFAGLGTLHRPLMTWHMQHSSLAEQVPSCSVLQSETPIGFAVCWWTKMDAAGFPLGHRRNPYVYFWNAGHHPGNRGFNLLNPVRVSVACRLLQVVVPVPDTLFKLARG